MIFWMRSFSHKRSPLWLKFSSYILNRNTHELGGHSLLCVREIVVSARQIGPYPKQTRQLSRCECHRGIIGIQSQDNRSIYRQFDVRTSSDERIAKSFCGAEVTEPDCRAYRCLRCAGTEQAEAFPAFARPRPCCLLQSRVRNSSRWA